MKWSSRSGLAVITGGAGGIGSSFANRLAKDGYRLLLVDRRQKQLEALCNSITAKHGVSAEACVVDLCDRSEVKALARRLQASEVELLVNNAGFGSLDYFADSDAKFLLDMVDVHVAAPVALTRAVLPGMIERDHGAIINLSSFSGFLPSAGNVQYGSTKCFLAFFSQTLREELRGSNVRVQALCPGFIRTEFHDAACMKGFTLRSPIVSRLWMSADQVVDCSLRSLNTGPVIVIPGLTYSVLGRLAQMPLLRPIAQWITGVPRLPSCPASPAPVRPATPLVVAEFSDSPAQP